MEAPKVVERTFSSQELQGNADVGNDNGAGMKRFNTDRIRQRMRDQQERFTSKGKKLLLSSPPVRVPLPPGTTAIIDGDEDKENVVRVVKAPSKPPPLAISITMSEAEEEEDAQQTDVQDFLDQVHQTLDDHHDDHSDSIQNVSVWAMMEHYQDPNGKDPRFNLGGKIATSLSHDEDSKRDDNGSMDHVNESDIHWIENENGELIQSSFYTYDEHSSQIFAAQDRSSDDEQLSSAMSTYVRSPAAHGRKNVIFRTEDTTENDQTPPGGDFPPKPNAPLVQHISVRMQQQSSDDSRAADDELSSDPAVLLQESMVPSVQTSMETPEESSQDANKHFSFSLPSIRINDDSPLSQASLQISETKMLDILAETSSLSTAEKALVIVGKSPVQGSSNQTNEERFVYLTRIEQLEKSLQAQQNSTNEVQGRLKDRVVELEQALRVTAATPRGTIVEENPLKTLLNRNQTLVKEVRFADQTCVELSAKISALEANNSILQRQIVGLEQENTDLREEVDSYKKDKHNIDAKQEAKIEELSRELELIQADLKAKTIAEENLLKLARDAAGYSCMNLHDSTGVSLSSSIVSDFEISTIERSGSIEHSGFTASHSPHNCTDILQQFIMEFAEKAKTIKELEQQTNKTEQIRRENEFLGRQLGKVQEKLDKTSTDLEQERSQSDRLKLTLNRTIQEQEKLLETFERRLVGAMGAKSELPSADVEKCLNSLDKDFSRVKAALTTIKQESEQLVTPKNFELSVITENVPKEELLVVIQQSLKRMSKRYKWLENDVGHLVDIFSERLDQLTETVSLLRRSLIFEVDSVSLKEEDQKQDIQFKKQPYDHQTSGTETINATIGDTNHPDEDDELYQLMEEARNPQARDIEVVSDLDDMSRLLADDLTLESAVRTGSVFSSVTNVERWREPLEAAIKECQRVKERSHKLKEQIETQKATILHLEHENGRLSLNASRRGEEIHLVENALDEAKEELRKLQNVLESVQNEMDNVKWLSEKSEKERKFTQEANERLTKELFDAREEREFLKGRLNEQEQLVATLNKELGTIDDVCEEYKLRNEDLLVQLKTKEFEMTQKTELQLSEIRASLESAKQQLAEQKFLQQKAMNKLSHEVDIKLQLEQLVSELQNSKKQLLSDAEDRDLETQFAREDMRKERAELKTKLKETEKEAANLKESFSAFKEKLQVQMDEKELLIERLESQQGNLLSSVKHLMSLRGEFSGTIRTIGSCKEDLSHLLQSEDAAWSDEDEFSSAMNEIEKWKDLLPGISEEICTLHYTVTNLSDMELGLEDMKDHLSKYELREFEQSKQLEDERMQNEKLFSLLRQAEQEMERSTFQIKDMSESMATLQEREVKASHKAQLIESELIEVRGEVEKIRVERKDESAKLKFALAEKSGRLEENSSLLAESNAHRESLKAELEKATYQLRSNAAEQQSMRSTIESLEKKTTRLREYVRRLTTKCEEWEESYDKQSFAIEKLQEKNARIREKFSQIVEKYRKLAGDVQRRKRMHKEDRAKWSSERSNLNHVHVQLEQELEQIARELSLPLENME